MRQTTNQERSEKPHLDEKSSQFQKAPSFKDEIEKLREEFSFKFNRLESEAQGAGVLNEEQIKWYEDKLRALTKANADIEDQIHKLLNNQEEAQAAAMGYQNQMEERYRDAVAYIEKLRREREEAEFEWRTELTKVEGLCRKEKERAQKLLKTMADMQSADPYKLDNNHFISEVKALRYNIKNWARAQRLVPSVPPPNIISSYLNKTLGASERGPNYDFLKSVTPEYQDYTESSTDFKWLLQAYVWKRIVDLVFVDELWIGTRLKLDDEEVEYKAVLGLRYMKQKLEPSMLTMQISLSTLHLQTVEIDKRHRWTRHQRRHHSLPRMAQQHRPHPRPQNLHRAPQTHHRPHPRRRPQTPPARNLTRRSRNPPTRRPGINHRVIHQTRLIHGTTTRQLRLRDLPSECVFQDGVQEPDDDGSVSPGGGVGQGEGF
jgi:hypothetical protein